VEKGGPAARDTTVGSEADTPIKFDISPGSWYKEVMGVDARILIKITNPTSWLNAEELRQLSTRLTTVIGNDVFLLRPDEDRHALTFCIDDYKEYPEEYLEATGNELTDNSPAIFGQDDCDVPYLIAQPNEQFVEVHMFSRYYGEGYERGDWKTLSWVMMWCIFNIPDCEVWYGGDSSGILMEKMTAERMTEMTKFFLTSQGDEYMRHYKTAHKCEFCRCGVLKTGGSARGATIDVSYWSCEGCGSQWLTAKEGTFGPVTVTKYDPYGIDRDLKSAMALFDISHQIQAGSRQMFPFDGTFRQKYTNTTKALPAGTPLIESGE
jgi:hypothetical protein